MKTLLAFIACLLFSLASPAQAKDSTALILIDIQAFYFPGGSLPLDNPEEAAQKAAELLKFFREKGGTVIHVGHLAKSGTEFHPLVKPQEGEKILMKREVNAFLATDLDEFLRHQNVRHIVLCGMQTHMCLEGATRAAHDLGYHCTVAADACATRDLSFGGIVTKAAEVHAATLATLTSYARVTTVSDIIGQ